MYIIYNTKCNFIQSTLDYKIMSRIMLSFVPISLHYSVVSHFFSCDYVEYNGMVCFNSNRVDYDPKIKSLYREYKAYEILL